MLFRSAWRRGLIDCHTQPNVFMKWSGLVEGTGRRGGLAPRDASAYFEVTKAVWSAFGPDRLLFGSNWPVSLLFAPYDVVLGIARQTVAHEGPDAAPAGLPDPRAAPARRSPTSWRLPTR